VSAPQDQDQRTRHPQQDTPCFAEGHLFADDDAGEDQYHDGIGDMDDGGINRGGEIQSGIKKGDVECKSHQSAKSQHQQVAALHLLADEEPLKHPEEDHPAQQPDEDHLQGSEVCWHHAFSDAVMESKDNRDSEHGKVRFGNTRHGMDKLRQK